MITKDAEQKRNCVHCTRCLVRFATEEGDITAVYASIFTLDQEKTLRIVRESCSGKSQTKFALMRLFAANNQPNGSILFQRREIFNLPEKSLNMLRTKEITMIF
ncbi:MAG: hypothetical protein ACSLEL_03285 [Candidatus Malihini olakiniferum]